MKKLLLIILTTIALYGCKDDSPAPLSAFDKVSLAVITENQAKLTLNNIPIQGNGGALLKAGAVVIYKTNTNTYGKMKIVSIGSGGSGGIVIDVVNYNANGTIKSEATNLTINGSAYCDLDTRVQTNDLNIADFQIDEELSSSALKPRMNTGFYLYYNQ